MRALKAGAVDFLTKPVDPEELRAKVASLARLKGYNDEMRRRQVFLSDELVDKGSCRPLWSASQDSCPKSSSRH
jgi:DNA-binding response OmpR family regulator